MPWELIRSRNARTSPAVITRRILSCALRGLARPLYSDARRTLVIVRAAQGRVLMLMRKLGRTGLRVSALCLGGNTFGWTTDQKASEPVLDAYREAGGNFIDTADVYSRWAPGNKGGES